MILFTTGAALAVESGEPRHLKKFARFPDCEFLETSAEKAFSVTRLEVTGTELGDVKLLGAGMGSGWRDLSSGR